MIGKLISHYKILEQLGAGGMGVVYKAEDTKLKRTVAIKFLPPELTRDPEIKKRFILEAQAASALEHNNICNIHEIDETDDGQTFITMACYEGETLKERIDRGPLRVEDAIDIAIQISQGLTKAHEKGIIHRDIKPSNIFIASDGVVKIIDFGLAKLAGRTVLTKAGSTLGTVKYMSPEQTRGEEVDHRTDIWSLGVVLYEMISGQLPFKGEYEQAVVHSIINEVPYPLTGLRTGVPPELEKIVKKCLEKDPADRYQHMDELIVDLRQLKKDSDSKKTSYPDMDQKIAMKKFPRSFLFPGIIMITLITLLSVYFLLIVEVESKGRIPVAVADFINETDEQELDGLSGMLITALEQSHRLNVLTRTRMFDILEQLGMEHTKRIDESIGREICREANINMLAIATIRKFGKVYTIDFKVLEVEKNEYLFTTMEKGEGQESIPALIDNLSEKTREGLKEKLVEIEATSHRIAQVTTPNLEAYQHYFKGEEYINKLQFNEAEEEFNKAIVLDSTFGLAYYRLAYAINWEKDAESARKYIHKAMRLLDRIPEKEKYLVRAEYLNIEEDFGNGVAVLKEMEKKYPDNKEMIYNIGDWSWHLGDYATAKTYLERVLASDPKFERALQHLIWTYRDMGHYEKMLDIAKRYVAVASSSESFELLIEAYIYLQDFETGLKAVRQIQQKYPDDDELIPLVANIYIQMEKYEQAEAELKILIQDDKSTEVRQVGYESLVRFYPYVGKYQNVFEIIDQQIARTRQNNDSLRVAYLQVLKVIYLQRKFNDISIDWEEVTETLRIQRKIKSTIYWATMSLLYLYHGDYQLADSVTRSISSTWWYFTIRSCIYSRKHECQKAKFYADSVIHAGPGFCKIQALYSLAQCQYNMEKYDSAEKSLLLLQDIRDQSFGFRSVYYPKSYYLLARVYEKKNQFEFAVKNYQKFVSLWKDGDKDLPELIDGKKRLAELIDTK